MVLWKSTLRHRWADLKRSWSQKIARLMCCDQFSWSYQVMKFWIRREWHNIGEYIKHFIPRFLCISLIILWKKSFTQFTVSWLFWPFLMNSWNCWMIKVCLDVMSCHTRKWTKIICYFSLRFKLLVDVLFLYDKGLISAKVITLISGSLI